MKKYLYYKIGKVIIQLNELNIYSDEIETELEQEWDANGRQRMDMV